MALAKNSIEGKAADFLRRIENLVAEGESAKGTYMADCKDRRNDIKGVYKEAKDSGVPKKALQGLVKQRELQRKIEAIPDGFDDGDANAYEILVAALGPLGEAAAKAAGHAPKGDASAASAH